MSNSPAGDGLLIIERILRDRAGIWEQIVEQRGLRTLIMQMLSSSAISLALYGTVLGASYGWAQALSSLIKLPLLFLATLAICLPTLYLFNLVFGARLSMVQAVALILVSITVTAVLTLAFAPISLFFLVTAQSYAFFKLLNVAILMLTAIVGLRFLLDGMRALNAQPAAAAISSNGASAARLAPAPPAPGQGESGAVAVLAPPVLAPPGHASPVPQRPASMGLVYIWIVLFGFVGTQLAWTLRPFFGSPGAPFAVFRQVEGTFYGDILDTIGRLLS
ncbi:hypothetical protein WEI85_30110 [Actinomycetes bacterium KLBMP 9797]